MAVVVDILTARHARILFLDRRILALGLLKICPQRLNFIEGLSNCALCFPCLASLRRGKAESSRIGVRTVGNETWPPNYPAPGGLIRLRQPASSSDAQCSVIYTVIRYQLAFRIVGLDWG
jgi:hypothetical protein